VIAFVAAGAGFLLAVLWFDLMFDVTAAAMDFTSATVHSQRFICADSGEGPLRSRSRCVSDR
jgi:hypothetical protein